MRRLTISSLVISVMAFAEALDPSSEKALKDVMQMLSTPEQRQQELQKNPKAKEADALTLEVTGSPENQQKLYELSAKVMEELTRSTGGDPKKMEAVLEKASKDPDGFAKTLSPETQKFLKQLAADVEKTKGSNAPQAIH